MKKKLQFTLIFLFMISTSALFAGSHYSHENAEELKNSGKIKWRDYGPAAFNEAWE